MQVGKWWKLGPKKKNKKTRVLNQKWKIQMTILMNLKTPPYNNSDRIISTMIQRVWSSFQPRKRARRRIKAVMRISAYLMNQLNLRKKTPHQTKKISKNRPIITMKKINLKYLMITHHQLLNHQRNPKNKRISKRMCKLRWGIKRKQRKS